MRHLEGRTALVTGAARGFGWGIARALGQNGASVCLTDINEEELARAEVDLRNDGTPILVQRLDVADRDAFQAAVDEVVQQWGKLDILVNNAIFMPLVRFDAMPPSLWQKQIDVGIGGLFNATYSAWAQMKKQGGGHIMAIASGSSLRGYRDEVAYCTIKHAQEGFVKALALESADFNISVNTVGPGRAIKTTRVTWTELDAMPDEEKANWADPVELGLAFVWLASQPPSRFSGLRFDAGPVVDTIRAEGFDFEFSAQKVTLYVDDFLARQQWQSNYPDDQ